MDSKANKSKEMKAKGKERKKQNIEKKEMHTMKKKKPLMDKRGEESRGQPMEQSTKIKNKPSVGRFFFPTPFSRDREELQQLR